MSLRKVLQQVTLLSRDKQCYRHFVRLRKRTIAPEVMEKHLDPEWNPSLTSKMNLVSQQEGDLIFITKYSGLGFGLHNGIKVAGPTVFFPRHCLKWKVYGVSDLNEKSLGLFSLLSPKLDLLIIGTGTKKQELHPETIKFLRKHELIFEVQSTDQAIAAFNFQNNDQRWIAAALIPPFEAKADLLHHVQSMYQNILDSTDLVYKEEELPQIESTQEEGTKRLEDSLADGGKKVEQLKVSEDKNEEIDSDELDTGIIDVKSPLGQSLDFLSSASLDRKQATQEEQTEDSETSNEQNTSEENKTEVKKTD